MEQLVIIGLLIVIVIILLEKKLSQRKAQEEKKHTQFNLPSIIGDTKKEERQSVPSYADQSQSENNKMGVPIFESETNSQGFDNNDLKKNLDQILARSEVWEEEEEDWVDEMEIEVESGFATGVTFQELNTAGHLLQQDMMESDLKQQTVDIIQRIHGTELFDLLENSLGGTSKRIAILLNQSVLNNDDSTASNYKGGVEGFDIGEFV